jgi:hypothetical protein
MFYVSKYFIKKNYFLLLNAHNLMLKIVARTRIIFVGKTERLDLLQNSV